jgi:hypothetical protein
MNDKTIGERQSVVRVGEIMRAANDNGQAVFERSAEVRASLGAHREK